MKRKITLWSICWSVVVILGLNLGVFSEDDQNKDVFENTNKNISELSEEESKTLEQIYLIDETIKALASEQKIIQQQLNQLDIEINQIMLEIQVKQKTYDLNKEALKNVLLIYQQRGSSSFFEILLEATSISDFMSRINTMRDLARNTEALMNQMKEEEKQLNAAYEKLKVVKNQYKNQEDALQKNIETSEIAKVEQENILSKLQERRIQFENYLLEVQKEWERILPVFAKNTEVFLELAEAGAFSEDALVLEFSFLGIKGTISEAMFNQMITSNPQLIPMVFQFNKDQILLKIPDQHLELQGIFVIEAHKKLVFQAQKGSFYNLPLGQERLDQLFEQGNLILDMTSMLQSSILKEIFIKEQQVDFTIDLNLFQ